VFKQIFTKRIFTINFNNLALISKCLSTNLLCCSCGNLYLSTQDYFTKCMCFYNTELVKFWSSENYEQYGIICVLLCAFQFGPITVIDFMIRY
jgi:hypothetical protein